MFLSGNGISYGNIAIYSTQIIQIILEVSELNSHSNQARAYFLEGYNCSQSVFLAFHEELGLDKEMAARLASSFGGGMGRLREVCGAVSGMFLAAGLLQGYSDPRDAEGKKAQYALVQELAEAFRNKNGSIVCRELLGLDHKSDAPTPQARTREYYAKRPCADLVADAARILEERLLQVKEA